MPAHSSRQRFRFSLKPGLALSLSMAGLALATALIGLFGFHLVMRELLSVGARGLAILCGWQVALFVVLGLAWAVLLPEQTRRPAWRFVWARAVRDATASCLPFTQAGGFFTGPRAAVLLRVPWPVAVGSLVVDLAREFSAELVLITLGLLILLLHQPSSPWVWAVLAGLGVGLPVAAGFLWLQSRGNALFTRLLGRILKLARLDAGRQLDRVRAELDAFYRAPRRWGVPPAGRGFAPAPHWGHGPQTPLVFGCKVTKP